MAVAAPTFHGFRPEAIQFWSTSPRTTPRDWFQPRKGEYERLLKEPMEQLCIALNELFRSERHPPERGSGEVAIPYLPRRSLLQGQAAVQDRGGREFRLGGRWERGARAVPRGQRPCKRWLLSPSAWRDLRWRWGLAPGPELAQGLPRSDRGRLRRLPGDRRGSQVPRDVRKRRRRR